MRREIEIRDERRRKGEGRMVKRSGKVEVASRGNTERRRGYNESLERFFWGHETG